MNQLYGEPVNVRARDDGRPIRFVWRGRLYTVRAILEHWVISKHRVINREWWRDPGTPGNPGEPELEFWRVEAAAGQGLAPGVFELRRDAATGAWTLRQGFGRPGSQRQGLSGAPQVLDVARRRAPHHLPGI
jgi:hypothetical protein